MNNDIKLYATFSKVDEDQRMVYGYCSSESVDSQGEVVMREAIRRAWDAYMEYANVREMHQPSAVGVTKEYMHDETGTWIGVKVVDDRAWKFVKEGVYKGFSIGGKIVRKNKNVIQDLILSEISLVDRPANPKAKFDAYKMDGELVERLRLEAININKAMNKFVEIDGVKYQEDPNNPGQPLVDAATGEKVKFVEEAPAPAAEVPVEAPKVDAPASEVPVEAPKEEPKAPEAPVEAPVPAPETPVQEPAPAAPVEPAKADAPKDVQKDSTGVVVLADVLSHMDYVMEFFRAKGKDVAPLMACKQMIMEAVGTEAASNDDGDDDDVEMGAKTADLVKAELTKTTESLTKSIGEQIEKVASSIKAEIGEISKRVEAIEKTKVSPRPATAFAVEKGFVNGSGDGKTYDQKKAAVDTLKKEIDEHALAMKSADVSQQASMEAKSRDLYSAYRVACRELEAHQF